MPVQTDELRTVMSLVGAQSFQSAMNGATRSVDRYNRAVAQSNEGMGHQFDPRANRWRNQETGQFAAFAGGASKMHLAIAAGIAIIAGYAAAIRLASAAVSDAKKTWAELEDVLKDVELQSGATAAEMQEIKQAVLAPELTALGVTATEAALGYKRLASEGYNALEMQQMMLPITEASIALGQDQAETTLLMLNVMRQFGLEAQDMTMIADALSAAVAKTSLQGNEVLGFFRYAGVTAGGFNWTLGETVAVADALVEKLGNAETAGEYFRQMMNGLVDPSADMTAAFAQAGLDVRDFGKHAGSAIDFLQWLQSGTWDSMLVMKAFGVRAGDAANILVNKSIPAIKETALVARQQGVAHEMASGKTNTWAGRLRVAAAEVTALKAKTGEYITQMAGPYLATFVNALKVLNEFVSRILAIISAQTDAQASMADTGEAGRGMAEVLLKSFAAVVAAGLWVVSIMKNIQYQINNAWLYWMKFMNMFRSTEASRRNIQKQESYVKTLKDEWQGYWDGMLEAWNWVTGDATSEALDKLQKALVGGPEGLWDDKRGTKPLGGDRAAGDDAAKAETDAEAEWQKARERVMAAWDRYYSNQQKLTDDRLTELQLELAAAQKAYDLALSYSQEVATRTGDVDKTTDAIAKVEDAWSRVLDAQKALRGYYAQAAKEYQDGLLKANEAAGKDMADAIRKQMKVSDVVQYVLGGRLGENIEERIGRLKGVRRQGDSRIVLELRGTDATMKEQVMQWLVPVLQDAGRRTPVMGN